jgi:hypothetical protein
LGRGVEGSKRRVRIIDIMDRADKVCFVIIKIPSSKLMARGAESCESVKIFEKLCTTSGTAQGCALAQMSLFLLTSFLLSNPKILIELLRDGR